MCLGLTRIASGCQALIFRACGSLGAGALFWFMAARLLLSAYQQPEVNQPARRSACDRRGAVLSAHLKNERRGSLLARLELAGGSLAGGSVAGDRPGRWRGSARPGLGADRWPVAARRGLAGGWPVIGVTATSADQKSGGQLAAEIRFRPVTSDNRSRLKSSIARTQRLTRSATACHTFSAPERRPEASQSDTGGGGGGRASLARARQSVNSSKIL